MGPTCLFSTIGWSYIWRTPQVAQNCFRAPILKSRFLKLRFHVVLSLEKIIFYWNWTLKIHLLDSYVVFFEIRRKVTNHSTLGHNLPPPPPSRCHVWPGECVEFLRVWVCVGVFVCVCVYVCVCTCVRKSIQFSVWFGVKSIHLTSLVLEWKPGEMVKTHKGLSSPLHTHLKGKRDFFLHLVT